MAADTAAAAILLIFDLCLTGEKTGTGAGPSLARLPEGLPRNSVLAHKL